MVMYAKNEIQLLSFSLKRAEDYLRWFNDPEVNKYLLPITPKTKTQIVNWIDKTVKDKSCLYFSIYLPKQKIFVGHIGLKEIDTIKKEAEVGIVIGEKEYWQKGIGTVAFQKLLQKIKHLGLKKIFATINKNNTASIKFFSKLGFEKSPKEEKDTIIFVYHL